MFGYESTSGFNEHVGKALHLSGDTLMQPSIYGLWGKWEKLQQVFRNRSKVSGDKSFVQISVSNSEVHLIFVVYLVGISLAVLFFGTKSIHCLDSWKLLTARGY